MDRTNVTLLECDCQEQVVIKTSWTTKNPGRRFYGCRDYQLNGDCDFFQWLDPPAEPQYKSLINGLLKRVKLSDRAVEDELSLKLSLKLKKENVNCIRRS